MIYYLKISDEIRAFEVNFNFDKEALRNVKNIVERLNSKDISKIGLLPECPDFIHREECQFRDTCKSI